jgi:hypothetical protein
MCYPPSRRRNKPKHTLGHTHTSGVAVRAKRAGASQKERLGKVREVGENLRRWPNQPRKRDTRPQKS